MSIAKNPKPNPSQREQAIAKMAERMAINVIIGIGFAQADAINKVERENPDLYFAIVDSVVDVAQCAVYCFQRTRRFVFSRMLAALRSKTGTISFVGGMDIIGSHLPLPIKQERFILPAIPFILIFGAIGWQEFRQTSRFKKWKAILFKCLWGWFWLINSLLLSLSIFYYSKETLVETFSYLHYKQDIQAIAVENNQKETPIYLF